MTRVARDDAGTSELRGWLRIAWAKSSEIIEYLSLVQVSKFLTDMPFMLVNKSIFAFVLLLGNTACSDSKFGGATGVRKANVELTRNALPSVSPSPSPTPQSTIDVLEGGIAVSEVAINMDDRGGNVDYNDTAYCFTFKGKFRGTDVVSDADQIVSVNRTNQSAWNHDMELRILDASKNFVKSVRDDSRSRSTKQFTISMKRGEFLDVVWHVNGLNRAQADPTYFKVERDCRNFGG